MACDICGKTGTTLESLNAEYQTKEIKDICSPCAREVNEHLWKLRSLSNKMNGGFLKKFMLTLRGKS